MLTNFKTMRRRIDRLNQLKKMEEDGTFNLLLPKKEVVKLSWKSKLEKYLGGVKEMKKLPGALFVIDPRKEKERYRRSPQAGCAHRGHRGPPTAIPMKWIMSSPATTTLSAAYQADQPDHGQRRAGGRQGEQLEVTDGLSRPKRAKRWTDPQSSSKRLPRPLKRSPISRNYSSSPRLSQLRGKRLYDEEKGKLPDMNKIAKSATCAWILHPLKGQCMHARLRRPFRKTQQRACRLFGLKSSPQPCGKLTRR